MEVTRGASPSFSALVVLNHKSYDTKADHGQNIWIKLKDGVSFVLFFLSRKALPGRKRVRMLS